MKIFIVAQDEVPPHILQAHIKNVEGSMVNGKFDPTSGLANSGIAGTVTDKEDEENKNANVDEEMRDVSKKDGELLVAFVDCRIFVVFFFLYPIFVCYSFW